MIHFFRDVLDGPVYIALVVICIFGILGILGFMMERLKKKEEDSAVKNIDAAGPHQATKLVLSSDSLDTPLQTTEEEKLPEEMTKPAVLDLTSDVTLEMPTEEETVSTPESTNETQSFSQPEEGVLSISSNDVKVEEMADINEQTQEPKVKDMTQVIDFGSTDDVDINGE